MAPEAPDQPGEEIVKFGMFKGVLVPTLLTILGVIMYLRLGWVVGNVGLLGAWTIILIAFAITTATTLSMSSIISNIRIGAGGAYSIISRSMGLEIGGSIGMPLYLALALSVALYIFGFRAGLQFLYPGLSSLAIDLAVFALLFVIVFLSTDVAFRIQYLILVVIIGSLISVFAVFPPAPPPYDFVAVPPDISFWMVFAVFFPAATGIMAGANMSGELKDPRRAIPQGTLLAIVVSGAIYLALAWWLAASASPEQLVGDYTFMISGSRWNSVVLAGLLAATFSSALNSLVGASRILHAMGEHAIMPRSSWFSSRTRSGIPRHALLVTGGVVLASLMLRDLNIIAPLITMFFLITYGMINIVILIEQNLQLVSFRPLFRIPRAVPLVGTVGCIFAMFIINPVFSLIALFFVAVLYYVLMSRHLSGGTPYGDVRSSLFVAMAEWAAKKSMALPRTPEKAWRPHLLIPILAPAELRGMSEFIRDVTYPSGSVRILGISMGEERAHLEAGLPSLSREFEEDGIYTKWTMVETDTYADGVVSSIQALKDSFFSPNIIFLRLPEDPRWESDLRSIIGKAADNLMGVLLYAPHPAAGLGRRRRINLWIAGQCLSRPEGLNLPNCDLAILTAYKLAINWEATIRILAPVADPGRAAEVQENLAELVEQTRIPVKEILVEERPFSSALSAAPAADLEIFSLPPAPDFDQIRETIAKTRTSCLFCRDSEQESALI
ncbi:MAG: Na-K-Cl cotransporter [Methanomicrobiales archaeon]|nr:Na-K-Cl cotransporter [Methanomicrobiales archaeon]